MKLLHRVGAQCSLLLFMLLVQGICLWTVNVAGDTIRYIFFMEGFLFVCYLVVILLLQQKELRRLRDGDYKVFLEKPLYSVDGEEVQRIVQELAQELSNQKQLYHNEKSEREKYFQIWIHQIKTPIFAMRMMSEHIQDEERKKAMRAELFKVERYTQMALNFQRMDDDYIMEKCHLHKLVQEALRSYSTMFIEKGLTLDYTYEDTMVYTDRKWMVFVIEQLLDNAVKYTQQGTIHVHCEHHALTIEDEGCGIVAEDLALIMRKGYTGQIGRQHTRASGMGLYFVKEICARLHADIKITSEVKKGTMVCVSLVHETIC